MKQLWGHQKEAVERASGDYFGLFFEVGTGKTPTMISILKTKYNAENRVIPTVILCPPVVISNWKREFSEWSKIDPARIIELKGSALKRLELISNAEECFGSECIYITNYEALLMKGVYYKLTEHIRSIGALVLDESHKCKDSKAQRTKLAMALSRVARYRYIMTGTPVLNNLMDVFTQVYILDGGKLFGGNFFSFRAKYFEDKNAHMDRSRYFPNWKPRIGSASIIKNAMAKFSMYVDKKSCLTLPPLVRQVYEVEMSPEQKRMYTSMKTDLIATINTPAGGKVSIAELAITKALRLQQIVSGHIKTDDESVVKIKSNLRKQALKEVIEDLVDDHKVIIWAVFHANYEDIREVCADLKVEFAELHGLVKDKDAEAHRFRTDSKCRVLIGHPGSGGIGVNLIEASYMVYYSRSFNLEYDIQSEARCYRGGSEIHDKITRIDLVTRGTIDELVLDALTKKQEMSLSVLKERVKEL